MATALNLELVRQPIAVELDDATFASFMKSTKQWLDHTLMLQTAFREQAEDVHAKIEDMNVRDLLAGIIETARTHERRAGELHAGVGRGRALWRRPAGALTARVRAALADLVGTAGGAAAPWRDLQQLFVGSLTALNAFGAAEQLGYALGQHELAQACFEIVAEKHRDHLVLQELTLEFVPWGVLYKTAI